jgi:hypothetical protein
MFAIRRYEEGAGVPPRHPLLLSHIDEYWVDVLAKAGWLQPIPQDKLEIFSRPTGATAVIRELSRRKRKFYLEKSESTNLLAVPQMGNVGMLIYRKDLVPTPPGTWEELEAESARLRRQRKPYQLLLETHNFDTLVVTALELGWSHGVFWRTDQTDDGLRVTFKKGSRFSDLVRAIERLHGWIHGERPIVPLQSSVDPARSQDTSWAFARHWYSTWVDVLTRPGLPPLPDAKDARYGVARIPIAESYRARQARSRPGRPPRHHSASGEWYLAIQRGSENLELGIDLINNLMTTRKMCERALSGAELPIFERFYTSYGDTMCFGADQTFSQLRQMFGHGARSRTEFANYRAVARLFYGALSAVVTNERAQVRDLLETAFREMDPRFRGDQETPRPRPRTARAGRRT